MATKKISRSRKAPKPTFSERNSAFSGRHKTFAVRGVELSKMPIGVIAPLKSKDVFEAISRLENALGMLDCLEEVGGPHIDLGAIDLRSHVRAMATSAQGVRRLVHSAQTILVEAPLLEVAHG